MQSFARVMMLACALVTGVALLGVTVSVLLGDPAPLFDILGLPLEIAPPPLVVLIGAFVLFAVLALCLLSALWAMHRVLSAARQRDFDGLTGALRTAGRGLIGFWGCFAVLSYAYPFAMVWNVPQSERPVIEWFPIDLDAIILVIGIVLIALAGAFRQAAEIERENKEFF